MYHIIPDISNIKCALATEYGTVHEELTADNKDDEENNIEFPLLSTKSWRNWDDKLCLKLL